MIILEPVRIGELLAPMATLIVGTAQCWLIGRGLRRMDLAAVERERQAERQEREAERRHQETMAQWNRLHEENMARHREFMAQHEENMTALRTLIKRTAAPGPGSRRDDV
ncbi:MAG: hypothetical protein OXU75_15770 [Deltaproteobacteria bacterium]|nr:hypothetical protein [Deltaproteobacteria bacterium]